MIDFTIRDGLPPVRERHDHVIHDTHPSVWRAAVAASVVAAAMRALCGVPS